MSLINCPECGKEVSPTAIACPNCGYGVKKHFDDIKNAEIAAQRQVLLEAKKEQRNKALKVVLPIMAVIAILSTAWGINHSIMSQRISFANEVAMMEYLTDYTCWELDNDYREEYLAFYKHNLCALLSDGIMNSGDKIILHPKRGYFERGYDKYIVSSSGDIVSSDKKDYYKPRFISCNLENGYKVLDVEILNSELKNGTFNAEYIVTNTGNKSYCSVELETIITLSDGEQIVLDDFEYVSPDEESEIYIRPNKTGTTKAIAFDIPDNAKEFEVHVKNYETEHIFD